MRKYVIKCNNTVLTCAEQKGIILLPGGNLRLPHQLSVVTGCCIFQERSAFIKKGNWSSTVRETVSQLMC